MTPIQYYKSLFYKIAGILTAMLVINFTGCGFFSSAPENRARDFVKLLIMEPDNDQRLRELSRPDPVRGPLELAETLTAKVALDYLRAKYRQGVNLDFKIGNVQNQGDNRKITIIVATNTKTKAGLSDKVEFYVFLEKGAHGWQVIRVGAEE